MKKILAVFLALLIIVFQTPLTTNALELSAESAIVVDLNSSIIVYEKNAHQKRGMASTTKIMTALVILENCPLDKVVCVPVEAVGIEGSSIYLKAKEHLTVEQLLYAMLLQSANDAATCLAIETAGSVEQFANMMNEKAEELGLKETHFTNPHGLYDEDHYTTAYELALITKCAMQNDTFRKIVSTKKAVIPSSDGNGSRVLVNHNKLLNIYDSTTGVKTGFTKKTGRCLVSSAEKDGVHLIAVTLNAPNDWNDHKSMLDLGFQSISTFKLASAGELCYKVPLVGGTEDYVELSNTGGLVYTCQKDKAYITKEVIMRNFYFAPVVSGEVLGQVIFYDNGDEIGRVDLVAQKTTEKKTVNKKLFGLF